MDATARLTRRGLMGLGGGIALTFAGGTAAAAAVRTWQPAATTPWRRSAYARLIGQTFSVRGYASALTLAAVRDLHHAPAGSEHAFALHFQTPDGAPAIPSSLGVLAHPTLGTFPLMLVSGDAPGAARGYVAVINRTHA